ncbi:outer membrane beta-barrel protein [Mucilaginibacter pedocola]|uniref:Outer membrane protein beta-barrel domain-containing protein n=1 Tax=Mucilaginibacter pedocola TaxID=1792845 RepID=A0A1S9PF96_9SPHI|nr:outer membrane beta-barrel protein [Mucilaginibacter pedocola]OOQ59268.1 hypothetical protein BC343_28520 [Mucilaginibacter pedocola]
MKKLLLSVVCLAIAVAASAQKLELTAGAYSGLFKYSGASSASSAMMLVSRGHFNSEYTNSPYGNKFGVGYGLSAQAQLVSKGGFIVGVQTAFEQLRSKVDINEIVIYNPISSGPGNPMAADGSTAIKNTVINLNPHLGYRIPISKIKLDILAGTDIGFITDAREKGSAKTDDGTTYKTNVDRKTISTDFRLRFGLAAHLNKFSLNASYAHGLRNYMEGYVGGTNEAYSRVVRVGLGYRLL